MNGAVACRWKAVRASAWLPLGASGAPSLFALGLVCTVACLAGLALLSRRHRATLAALALSGFCWALLARSTAYASHRHALPLTRLCRTFSR